MEATRVKAEEGSWHWLSWGRTGEKQRGAEWLKPLEDSAEDGGSGLQGRIIYSWRLKRLRTSSWRRAQHPSRRGAEGLLLYLSVTIKGLRNLWMREEEGELVLSQARGGCAVIGGVRDKDTPTILTRGSRVRDVRTVAIAAGCGCSLLGRDRLQRQVPEREGDL